MSWVLVLPDCLVKWVPDGDAKKGSCDVRVDVNGVSQQEKKQVNWAVWLMFERAWIKAEPVTIRILLWQCLKEGTKARKKQ